MKNSVDTSSANCIFGKFFPRDWKKLNQYLRLRPTSGTAENVNMSIAPFSTVTSSKAIHNVASYNKLEE